MGSGEKGVGSGEWGVGSKDKKDKAGSKDKEGFNSPLPTPHSPLRDPTPHSPLFERLPKISRYLELHERWLGVRAIWLAWVGLVRLSGSAGAGGCARPGPRA